MACRAQIRRETLCLSQAACINKALSSVLRANQDGPLRPIRAKDPSKKSPALNRPGFESCGARDSLEVRRHAQVHDAAIGPDAPGSAHVSRTIHDSESSAEHIGVRDAPARMVEDVAKAGEQFQPHPLFYSNLLQDRVIEGEGPTIPNEENLSKAAGRSIRHDVSRVRASIRTDETQ